MSSKANHINLAEISVSGSSNHKSLLTRKLINRKSFSEIIFHIQAPGCRNGIATIASQSAFIFDCILSAFRSRNLRFASLNFSMRVFRISMQSELRPRDRLQTLVNGENSSHSGGSVIPLECLTMETFSSGNRHPTECRQSVHKTREPTD